MAWVGLSGGRGLAGVGLASRYETRQVASWRGMSMSDEEYGLVMSI